MPRITKATGEKKLEAKSVGRMGARKASADALYPHGGAGGVTKQPRQARPAARAAKKATSKSTSKTTARATSRKV